EDQASAQALAGPDAELGLRAAECVGTGPSQALVEAAGLLDDGPAERHVAAHEVADVGRLLGEPPVRAADHPVELAWEPGRSGRLPVGGRGPADAEDVGIAVV